MNGRGSVDGRLGRVGSNAKWSVAEFAVLAGVQFLVLRLVVGQLGVASLGLWASLMALAQMSKFGDAGFAAGASRLLAAVPDEDQYRGRCAALIAAALVPSALLYGLLATFVYLALVHGWTTALPQLAGSEGRSLLQAALLTFVAQSMAAVSSSLLLGLHAGRVKSRVNIGCGIAQGLLAAWLVRTHGLIGLAWAQIAGFSFSAALSLFWVHRLSRTSWPDMLRLDTAVLREAVPSGAGAQAASSLWSVLEIATRLGIARVGGLEAAGLFEVAQKLCSQVRVLCAQVAQTIAPRLSHEYVHDRQAFECSVVSFTRVYAALAGAALVLLALVALPYEWLMLRSLQSAFLPMFVCTAFVAAAQVATMPAEVVAAAVGVNRWNALGYVLGVGVCLGVLLLVWPHAGDWGVWALATCGYMSASLFNMLVNRHQLGLAAASGLPLGLHSAFAMLFGRR